MKVALTDRKRVLGELVREFVISGDEQLVGILRMTFAATKTAAPFSVASRMEGIAAKLITIVPADKPVCPGSLYARLSALITSLQFAARKDQWGKTIDRSDAPLRRAPRGVSREDSRAVGRDERVGA